MSQKRRSWIIFFGLSFALAAIFFLLPINLFDGVIEYDEGVRQYDVEAPLSLSYFIGVGYDQADMVNVKNFYLKPKGIVMAILFIFGFPALISYRLGRKNR